ncbi:MAG: hypothetical protein J6T78_04040 [Bacteroidaceae bacterium]|nr:hypothetical protein [Bacteroidaceae bacterium]
MPKNDKKPQKDTKASVETTRQTAEVVDIQPVIADKTFVNLLKPADKVTVADVNAEMSKEYGWLGNDVVGSIKCVLRELVRARLEREKGGK